VLPRGRREDHDEAVSCSGTSSFGASTSCAEATTINSISVAGSPGRSGVSKSTSTREDRRFWRLEDLVAGGAPTAAMAMSRVEDDSERKGRKK
jgi:hypothetical protein